MQNTPKIERNNTTVKGTSRRDAPLSTAALYDMAEGRGIPVYSFPFHRLPSMSIIDDKGECTIGLQSGLGGVREHVCLAHEMGHCLTGTFYKSTSSGALRGKCEYKADKWAFYRLIPPTALQDAIAQGITHLTELAEHFEVTEEFLMRAMDFYACVRPI